MKPDDSRPGSGSPDEPVVIGSGLRDVEARLRAALDADARSVRPGDRLGAILATANEGSGSSGGSGTGASRGPWLAAAAAAAVAAVVAGSLWVAGRPQTPTQPVSTGTTTVTSTSDVPTTSQSVPTRTATSSATTTVPPVAPPTTGTGTGSTALRNVPVYWIGETGGAPRLFREFRTIPDTGGVIDSAVTAMTSMKPLDADYMTPWRPAEVTVKRSGTALTVDLSASAISGTDVGSQVAERAVQQLVYTATAAAVTAKTPVETVTILVDGKPADAWGTVRLGTPTRRADAVEVQSHVWVLSPTEGQEMRAGRVTFRGFGTSFEANFLWRITTAAGEPVAEGNTMGGSNGQFDDLTFSRTLPAGRYVVEISTDDPSGGAEGGGAQTDTKSFTLR